jgi:uncharacterized membrane protein SirB2
MAEPKVNVYASCVARTVFVWISLVLLIFGLIWDARVRKRKSSGIGQTVDFVQDAALTAVGFVPGYGTAISLAGSTTKWFKDNLGKILIIVNTFFLILYESCWRPWKHLKNATIDVPEETKESFKPKQK